MAPEAFLSGRPERLLFPVHLPKPPSSGDQESEAGAIACLLTSPYLRRSRAAWAKSRVRILQEGDDDDPADTPSDEESVIKANDARKKEKKSRTLGKMKILPEIKC